MFTWTCTFLAGISYLLFITKSTYKTQMSYHPQEFGTLKDDSVVTTVLPAIQRNCTKLFMGDNSEINKVKAQVQVWENVMTDSDLLYFFRNCSFIQNYFNNNNLYVTKLEREFPVAYTFVVYNSPQQVVRLLRYLYRPQNIYCIHPDKKSSDTFKNIFRALVTCLDNVIVPKDLLTVSWAYVSIIEAQMKCLRELADWRSKQPQDRQWKYVINLCGKEVPLTTTHEIITNLTRLNGTSAIHANRATDFESIVRVRGRKMPFNLEYYKSITYMALSYDFANFILTDQKAIQLYKFFRKNCEIPEEHYYATLFMMPGVPGGFNSKFSYFQTDSSFWLTYSSHAPCPGKNVHDVCIVTFQDLKRLLRVRNALFHNKYFMELDHVVMDCMEERLVERNRREYQQDCPKSLIIPQNHADGQWPCST